MDQTLPLSENIASAEELTSLIETPVNDNTPKDYFRERNGEIYAGAHVLADLWGAERLDDIEYMEEALRKAIEVCGATLLLSLIHI